MDMFQKRSKLYRNDHNLRWIAEAHIQNPEKLNVWGEIICNTIIGPSFIEGDLTGHYYLVLLEEAGIVAAIEKDAFDYDPIFQQDGASSHFYVSAGEYLDE